MRRVEDSRYGVYADYRIFGGAPQVSNRKIRFSAIEDIAEQRSRQGSEYLEFLRVPAMSAGVYVLAAGSTDRQSPHKQDELYYVVQGRARMRAGHLDQAVRRGTLIFVPAHVEHQFYDMEEEITVLVFFAPAEVE
jgi:mannose-6-phosphate isomerase-like protein (cupin superfamily)